MALEAELRLRVERSVEELDGVIASLQEVRRLADANQASSEQLIRVAGTMTDASEQMRALLQSINQAGTTLIASAETLRAADPAPAIVEMRGVVAESKAETASLRQAIAAMQRKVDAQSARLELMPSQFEGIGVMISAMNEKVANSNKDLTAGIAAVQSEAAAANYNISGRLADLARSVRTVAITTWVAVGLAAANAILAFVLHRIP